SACRGERDREGSALGTPASTGRACRPRRWPCGPANPGPANRRRGKPGRWARAPPGGRPPPRPRPQTKAGRPPSPGCGSRPRALENEFHEEPHPHCRGTLRLVRPLALRIRRPRDVEVHPRNALDEFTQEPAARDRAGAPAPRVLHVRDVRLEQVAILLPQRQRPAALARALPRLADFGEESLVVP